MKTLVLSDVHLGNGSALDIYAGGDVLPAVIDRFAAPGARILFNGDTMDFLMNQDPLVLDVELAVANARAIAAAPSSAAVLRALGRALEAGAEVVIRLGNHDVELALPEVQGVFRAALGVSDALAEGLVFQRGDTPMILDVGGARVLLSHGEQNDDWNRVDYSGLFGRREGGRLPDFEYSPGSRLVKTIMNPLKLDWGLRFADLLKPDFQGAVLALLAVAPEATAELFKASTITILRQLFRWSRTPLTFNSDLEQEPDLGLAVLVEEAGLSAAEQQALRARFGDGPISFGPDDHVVSALEKLGQRGLLAYARLHRSVAGEHGERFFQLTPDEEEWQEMRRLAETFSADAVVIGHTHAARFAQQGGTTYLNTGTWIHLMALPAPDADVGEWQEFLRLLGENPGLDPAKGPHVPVIARFTGAVIEPAEGGGAHLRLVQFHDAASPVTLAEGLVRPG